MPKGENARKLTDDQVRELRLLHKSGWNYVELAKRYGVAWLTAKRVADRIFYRRVK